MPSARRVATTATAPALLVTALAGCATTQQEAARLQLNSARARASERAVRVTRGNPDVRVQGAQLLAGHRESAIVVRIRNVLAHPVSDLPVSVGVTVAGGRRLYLNGAAGSDYFHTHIPAVPAGGVLTWVFTTRRPLAHGAHPFAAVGVQSPSLVPRLHTLPKISAVSLAGGARAGRGVRVIVRNLSSIPQYGLQVYLVARRSGRAVSAGRAAIAHLGARTSASVELRLVGGPPTGGVTLEAPPTVFG